MLRWLTELNKDMVISVHAPAKGLTAILIHVQSKSDSTMVKICPFTVAPLNPPLLQSTQAQPQTGQHTGPTAVAKRFENDKTFPQLLPENLMKSKLPFCHENELNPNNNIFTEFQTCYKITRWHHVSDSRIYTGECCRGHSCRSLSDPERIRGQTGSIKKMVMLEIIVLPLLTVGTCKRMHTAIIALDKRASEVTILPLVDLYLN